MSPFKPFPCIQHILFGVIGSRYLRNLFLILFVFFIFVFQVEKYLQLKGTPLEREMASEIMLHILDKIIQSVHALNSLQVFVSITSIYSMRN